MGITFVFRSITGIVPSAMDFAGFQLCYIIGNHGAIIASGAIILRRNTVLVIQYSAAIKEPGRPGVYWAPPPRLQTAGPAFATHRRGG
jgi:hypothetical protein